MLQLLFILVKDRQTDNNYCIVHVFFSVQSLVAFHVYYSIHQMFSDAHINYDKNSKFDTRLKRYQYIKITLTKTLQNCQLDCVRQVI